MQYSLVGNLPFVLCRYDGSIEHIDLLDHSIEHYRRKYAKRWPAERNGA